MLSKQQLRFAQKVVRKGWVKGGEMLACIELLNSDVGLDETTLMDILVKKGYLSRKQVREIERELTKPVAEIADGQCIQKLGDYELLEKLGEGAMGVVYKARKTKDNRLVALKLLDRELGQDREFISRFLREARNVAKLRKHENIVEAYDFGEDNGRYYFVMEFIDGRSLAEILYSQGKISERNALSIARQVTRALHHAQSFSIIHRDIKPENIIISSEGVVKLCDLGLAKDLSENFSSSGGVTLGTVYYASPEQASGSKNLDIRTDIYSLGISLYHMLAGELPFTDSNLRLVAYRHVHETLPPLEQRAPHVSFDTIRLVQKMTHKNPGQRHQNPQELLENIENILRGQPESPAQPQELPPDSSAAPAAVVFKKRKLKLKLYPYTVVALVLLAFALILFAFYIAR